MPKLLPSSRPPWVVVVYAAMIFAAAVGMYWSLIDSGDQDDDTFAAIWLVLFALPSSVIFAVAGLLLGIGYGVSVLLVISGVFQVWLLWTVIENRRTWHRDRRRE